MRYRVLLFAFVVLVAAAVSAGAGEAWNGKVVPTAESVAFAGNFDGVKLPKRSVWKADIVLGAAFSVGIFSDDYWSLKCLNERHRTREWTPKKYLLREGAATTYTVEGTLDAGLMLLSHKLRGSPRAWRRAVGKGLPILGTAVRGWFAVDAHGLYNEPVSYGIR